MKRICRVVAKVVMWIFLIGIIATLAYVCYFKATDKMTIDGTKSSVVAVLSINRPSNRVFLPYGDRSFACFLLDTGAVMNSITEETLENFRKAGYKIDEIFLPIVTHDVYGRVTISYKCYYITVHVKNDKGEVSELRNVRFVPGRSNILGQEFMKYFCVEVVDWEVYLHTEMPDGYDGKVDLKRFDCKMSDIGDRYYWDMVVNDTEHRFYIDTGKYIDKLALWFSAEECGVEIPEGEWMKTDSITFSAGDFINHKVGCSYMENMFSPYAVNPLGIDGYDWVFDLSNDAMYYRQSKQ